ncbi:SRPBCC family protein [Labilibaculum sp.]|uniref:SRPBCC family protein n=1 Tax=Labilibaculum sp. TaxID=2060723 RepID=UPI0035617422
MKILKKTGILLAILLLATTVLGLFLGKQQYLIENKVDRPVKKVFQLFTNHDRLSEWLSEVKSFEVIIETPEKIGSEYKLMVDNDGNMVELIEKLSNYKENKLIEIEYKSGWMHKYNHYSFSESEKGTKIVARYTIEGTNPLAKSLFLLFTKSFQKIDATNLERFKVFAEKQAIYSEPTNELEVVN